VFAAPAWGPHNPGTETTLESAWFPDGGNPSIKRDAGPEPYSKALRIYKRLADPKWIPLKGKGPHKRWADPDWIPLQGKGPHKRWADPDWIPLQGKGPH
jgi:hypothetical protein